MLNKITCEQLQGILSYNPKTGAFQYRVKRGAQNAGTVAGGKMVRGNWSIGINYKRYSAHRLAWLYMTGIWPENEIDHIDGNPLNNRWDNLREVTGAQNKQNYRRPRIDNKSGYLGVYLHGKNKNGSDRWRARINLDGKAVHLGLFDTPQEAHAAYVEAKRKLHAFGTL